ncbi:uncharacterized protein I303_108375 [Kwoniella dejecticola CBS 10117]|uniref:SAP domain-containing protein n=1 Tax=Kwoniella dejecticola CBS 10117 TaxID=1296121 RepID=A0A1A5ZXK6_9TREE|nr:uncharacterized protein I303_07298 [Kwoniella dejecticola CBS 10117]OBR82538.1 hypothetical protein I303_07298 [Kwoniella dejecticola CBS 10117]
MSQFSAESEAGPSTPHKMDFRSFVGSQTSAAPTTSASPTPSKVSKKQTVDQLKDGLRELGLDTKGKKETLWRRLVNAIHKASLRDPESDDSDASSSVSTGSSTKPGNDGHVKIRVVKQTYKSFLCFDVEATCRPGKEFDWPNEIIEFPVVLLQWTEPDSTGKRKLHKVDQFRSYVRPIWSPILSDFCKDLTGITQQTVDQSPTFPQMIKKFEKWLDKWDLRDDKGLKDALWVTDGPWDLRDFVYKQLHITPPKPFPMYFHGPYLNLKFAVQSVLSELHRRSSYAAEHPNDLSNKRALSVITTSKVQRINKKGTTQHFGRGREFYFNIPGMLEILGLGGFEGRQHSGLDDATNIARILIALSEKDVMFEANGIIHPIGHGKRYPWMGAPGEIKWEDWMSTNKPLEAPTSGGVEAARLAMGKTLENRNESAVNGQTAEDGVEQEEEVIFVGEEEMADKLTTLVLESGSDSSVIGVNENAKSEGKSASKKKKKKNKKASKL